MPRPLRPSERRFVFAISDAIAAALAVALAMWTWSITAGLPFSPTFVQARLWWFVAVPIWKDIDLLLSVANNIMGKTLCAFGDAAWGEPNPLV
jgi:hypothetical protein